MGVPKFFRYISERYPCLSELVKEFQIPDFDNLYLDMNGIIHTCSHPNDYEPHYSISEEKIFANIFHYIEVLFNMIKPRKLLFMAVDGVAPRAKMNQQRARRFRTAQEAEMKSKEALRKTGKPLPEDRFDSNCITPGTVFMDRLHRQLKYFVISKISTDPLWQGCKIILSGHQTPGEGEHKIMDYIRYLKTLPDYDSNTKHCLYGLDADLIMLGLCTHEPHFSLLREKVLRRQQDKKIQSPDETEFYLLHLSLLREYLDLEFQELKDELPFQYNLENIIDDWVLMSFLVGNDFIPNLPDLHINKDAFPVLYKAYKEALPALDGYLNENGYLNLPRFEQFMDKMAKFDLDMFEDTYANLAFLEEKTGRTFTSEKKMNGFSGIRSDLEELIKATEELEMSDEESFEEHNDNDDDTFLWEFSQHKKNYYTDKMDCRQVTPETLKSQAEGYIRAIQWNLHYYYQGCQSWSWYYPHHYAPYISDIKDFKDLKLDFDMGKPFLPFEQLLAVLPAASKHLLPEPYHDLMTSPDSPIKDFYPEDFETDLNGKQQDWEAVVLIPFIDEKRLLEAMQLPNQKLTPEESARNRHGPMHVFTYTDDDLGPYESAAYFPTLPVNHALMVDVSREEIAVDKSRLQYGLRPGVLMGVLYPGFPTLRHIPFTASLKASKVKVFDYPSRGQNMMLTLARRPCRPVKELAQELLGKIVYVNWPHLVESRAVGVSDGKVRYAITENECVVNEVLDRNMQKQWAGEVEAVATRYMNKLGIDVGAVDVLVYGLTLEGRKYIFGPRGKMTSEKVWSASPTANPLQVVVQDFPVAERSTRAYTDLKEAFPEDSVVFMLGQPNFGSMGRVLDSSECYKNSRLKVAFETVTEPVIQESLRKALPRTGYLPCRVAAFRVGVSCRLFSRITGVVLVSMSKEGLGGSAAKINIGLNMKFSKKNEELPGYTRKENDNWLYSAAAIDVACKYVQKFSRVIEYMANNQNTCVYYVEDIFPGAEGLAEMKEMAAWVKEQEYSKVKRVKCGTECLEPEAVSRLEAMVEKQEKKSVVREMKVKPQLLYKSDLVSGNVPPVKSAQHCLLDRVVSIRSSYTVPTGLRGFIIGIHAAASEADFLYDILFDQPFLGGLKLNSAAEKVFTMTRVSFLNVTDAGRQSLKSASTRFDLLSTTLTLNPSFAPPKTSAFVHWTHQPPHPSTDLNDDFRQMWLNLHSAKPQEDALKKILKIRDQPQPPIEDPVKQFFQKISTPNDSPAVPHNPSPPPTLHHRHLISLYQTRNLPLPRFKYNHLDDKVVAKVLLHDGRLFSSLPSPDKESACESASLQALTALRHLPPLPPNNRLPSALPNPPPQWMQPTLRPCPPYSPGDLPTRHATDHRVSSPSHRPPQLLSPPRNSSDLSLRAAPHAGNRRQNASALEFVPLQAITGKRNSPKVTTNRFAMHAPDQQKKTAVVATLFNNVGASPSTNKPRRRSKIAAKLDFDPNLY